jgi:hypothetical protein
MIQRDRLLRTGTAVAALTMALIAAAASDARAQAGQGQREPSNNRLTIPRILRYPEPTTDLTVPPWTQAARITGFFDVQDQFISKHATTAYLFYDRSTLWVAFRCEGQDTSDLQARYNERDSYVWRDDSVEILVDPAGDRLGYFHFVVNSTGALYDAKRGQGDYQSEAVVQVDIDPEGWTVVLAIPFETIEVEIPTPEDLWTMNLGRNTVLIHETDQVPAVRERSSWAPTPVTYTLPEYFGDLRFGHSQIAPPRLSKVEPITMGANRIPMDPLREMRYRLEGVDNRGETLWSEQNAVPEDGMLEFRLPDDRIRRISLTLSDTRENVLFQNTYPNESPVVAERIASLDELHRKIADATPRFPENVQASARALLDASRSELDRALAVMNDTQQHTADHWQELDALASRLERSLDSPASLAQTLALFPQADFAIGLASPMQKIMIQDFPFVGNFDDHYELALARNEREGFQVVLMPFGRDLSNASVTVSDLVSEQDGGPIPGGKVEVSLVGHVKVGDDQPYRVEYKNAWYPDPLLNFQHECDIKDGEHVAFWINIGTEPDTPAGRYNATVTVTADDSNPVELQLNVTVWDFELPKLTNLRNAFTYFRPYASKMYGDRWSTELAYKYYDFLLDYRLNIDNLYRSDSPDVNLIKHGAERGMNAFNVGSDFHRVGNNPERDAGLNRYVERLKEAGVWDMAYVYGFDEIRSAEQFANMRRSFGAVKEHFPGLQTMTTAYDPTLGQNTDTRDVVDIWVPVTDWYDLEQARKARAEGKEVWWYVCVVPYPPYANWFVESRAIEARLLTGAMSHKYEVDGFLYYFVNLWLVNHHVISRGPYTNWNPGSFVNEEKFYTAYGDGSIFCAGPDGPISTIRLENIRDGFEDYDYIYKLNQIAETLRAQSTTSAETREFLDEVDALLKVPDAVVATVTRFTIEPEVLAGYRTQVAEAIVKGKQLVDGQ